MWDSRPRLLMIHGAWHHGSLMEPVADLLRAQGWEVHCPVIVGKDPAAAPDPDVTMADMVASLRRYIEERDLTDLILYAHSAGGVLATELAPQIAPRLKRAVFHNAIIPSDGQTIYNDFPPLARMVIDMCKDEKTNAMLPPFPMWREGFIQDADLATAQATFQQLIPEPMATYHTPVSQGPFHALINNPDFEKRLPTSFLKGTMDNVLPFGHLSDTNTPQPLNGWGWDRYIVQLGSPRYIEIPQASHEVMFTNPGLLAEKIVMGARD